MVMRVAEVSIENTMYSSAVMPRAGRRLFNFRSHTRISEYIACIPRDTAHHHTCIIPPITHFSRNIE